VINLENVLLRIEVETLIKLLPYWQKAYFSNLSNSLSSEEITEFFLQNKDELLKQKVLFIIFEFFNSTENDLLDNVLINHSISKNAFFYQLSKDELPTRDFQKVLNSIFDFPQVVLNDTEIAKPNISIGPNKRFFELLDYQVFVKEQLLSELNQEKDRVRTLVHMPTGTGKTKTTVHTLIDYYMNTLASDGLIVWIAHTNTLLEQAEETFENVWNVLGLKSINVHRLYDNNEFNEVSIKKGIVFIGVAKLISISKKDSSVFQDLVCNAKLIIFDEAHKITASETSVAVQKLFKHFENNKKRLIGLTATPGRHNNNDLANDNLAEFFDRNIISINPMIIEQLRVSLFKAMNQELSQLDLISYFQERKILSKLIREDIEYDPGDLSVQLKNVSKKINQGDYSSEVIRVVSQDVNRNMSIINRLITLSNQGRQIIFFACGVEHGKFITSILRFNGIKAREIYGLTNTVDRLETIRMFKAGEINVLINCGVLTTGFDSTNIDCVFISRPTSSVVLYSQMIGRGLRGPKMGGNETCLLVDVKDNLEKYSDDNEIFNYFKSYWRG
jgi:DNA repair protein RadD